MSSNHTSPILTVTIEESTSKDSFEKSISSASIAQIIEWISQNKSLFSLQLIHYFLNYIEKSLIPLALDNQRANNKKLNTLRQSVPSQKPNTVFFPPTWAIENTHGVSKKNKDGYTQYPLKKSSKVEITVDQYDIICEIPNEKTIGLYFGTAKEGSLYHALALYHYLGALKSATIVINPKYADYSALILYLNAYQRIHEILAEAAAPIVSIKLQGGKSLPQFNEEEVDTAIDTIIQKNTELRLLLASKADSVSKQPSRKTMAI